MEDGEAHVLDDADESTVGCDFDEMMGFPLAEGKTLILRLIINRLAWLMSNVTHPIRIGFQGISKALADKRDIRFACLLAEADTRFHGTGRDCLSPC